MICRKQTVWFRNKLSMDYNDKYYLVASYYSHEDRRDFYGKSVHTNGDASGVWCKEEGELNLRRGTNDATDRANIHCREGGQAGLISVKVRKICKC